MILGRPPVRVDDQVLRAMVDALERRARADVDEAAGRDVAPLRRIPQVDRQRSREHDERLVLRRVSMPLARGARLVAPDVGPHVGHAGELAELGHVARRLSLGMRARRPLLLVRRDDAVAHRSRMAGTGARWGLARREVGEGSGMTSRLEVPTIDLTGEVSIPQFGLGVFQVPPEDTAENVLQAIEMGYRHIDTAKAYRNEAGVGQAIRASGLDRSEFFVTTKLFNDDHGYDSATRALKTSLGQLEMEHVDLYLIHWPVPSQDRYVETWQALIEAQQAGLARAIGVSNFQPARLERIIRETGGTPAVNQIELHPYLQQHGLRREHADRQIVTEAWSPLAQGAALDDPVITEIAQAHGKTPGQAVLRWHIQLGNVVFPKSVTPERIEQNIDIFDFELSSDELDRIEALDRGQRTGPDPETFNG